jgi:antitoxin component YwqK of YwqJK toxin-antitoxin module
LQQCAGESLAGNQQGNAMPKKENGESEHIQYHRDGSVWAKGQVLDGTPTGYWEWFRKDGTKMRSGTFADGEQVGEWTTYDRNGDVYKVTDMSRKKSRK